MKRFLITGLTIALSALGAIAPKASANSFETTVDVPFEGTVISACTVVPIGIPGVLTLGEDDPKTLTSTISGGMTVLCNEDFSVTAKTPIETTPDALPQQFGATTDSSSSVVPKDGSLLSSLAPGILHELDVNMSVSRAENVRSGAYFFKVPVTVTIN